MYAGGLLVAGNYSVSGAENQTNYRNLGGVYRPWVQRRLDETRSLPSSGAAATMVRPGTLALLFCLTYSRGSFHFAHGDTVCDGMNVAFNDGHVKWFNGEGAWWDRYSGLTAVGNIWWAGDIWVDGEGFIRGLRY